MDAIVKGIGKYVYDNAELLARMAVDETGIGVYEDKVLKNKGKARVIWNNLKDKKSRGIIGEDAETNMVFVAKPMGVVGAVTPVTNPVVTPMCNVMFAVKTGNAVIFAPHPKAEKLTDSLTREFMKIVKANGGPDDLIQTVQNGTIETTQELMKVVDVVVATGGGAMVKSAYSSASRLLASGQGMCRSSSIAMSISATPRRRSSTALPSTTESSARTNSSCWFRKRSTAWRWSRSRRRAKSGSPRMKRWFRNSATSFSRTAA